MTDKTQLPTDAEDHKNGPDGSDNKSHQTIFDALFAEVMNGFGASCEQQAIPTAIAIAVHPEHKQPLIFIRGHHYDVAVLLAQLLRDLKGGIRQELEC